MATNYPTSLDALVNPAAGDPQSNPPHAAQHANANDAVEALQAKVGVDGSAVATSLDYLVKKGVAIVSSAAPAAPVVNQLWYDTTAELLKRWDGDSWEAHDHNAAYQLKRFAIQGTEPAHSRVGSWARTQGTGRYFAYEHVSSGAQNAEVVYRIGDLLGGTWSVGLTHNASTNRGIYTVSVSADATTWTDLGSIDGYAAANTPTLSELSGVTVPLGMKFVRLKMATKNASSSDYFASFQQISGMRTGA